MKLRTIRTLKKLQGKRVLLRVDFNVPMRRGRIMDDTRIRETLPTINYLLKKGARVILMSHLGRPEGRRVASLKLDPIARHLSKLLKKKVLKLNAIVGPEIEKNISDSEADIVLLENLRFNRREEKNDPRLAKALARLGDLYASDAFGVCHRAHASTAGVAQLLPAYAGFLLEKEIMALTPLVKKPKRPLLLILGGAKIDTKIGVLANFLKKADFIFIGGALANTFLAAEGFDVGASLYEKDKLEVARDIVLSAHGGALGSKKTAKLLLPNDVIIAQSAKKNAKTLHVPVEDVMGNWKIFDIGARSLRELEKVVKKTKTIVWNGPVGLFEMKPFENGTKKIAQMLAKSSATTILGGGDTIEALAAFKISAKKFSHVSTGGGAMLEFLEGKKLPGLTALM